MKVFRHLVLFSAAFAIVIIASQCSKSADNSKIIVKIGKESISEKEFEALFRYHYKYSKPGKADQERRLKQMDKTIESMLMRIAAEEAGKTKDKDLVNQLASLRKRVIQRLFQEIVIEENGGFKEGELLNFFNANKNSFKDDSGNALPFDEAKRKVVTDYITKQANLDSFYLANKNDYLQIKGSDTLFPPLSENLQKVTNAYIRDYKNKLTDGLKDKLFSKYNVKQVRPEPEVTESEIGEFYKQNNAKYMSKEGYELRHIQMDSRQELENRMKNISDENSFKIAASQSSGNEWTGKQEGYIGKVKKGHCLPYGIGMFPKLFPTLDSLMAQSVALKVTAPMENPQTEKWHVFLLIQKYAPAPKSLEQVYSVVKNQLLQEKGKNIPPDAVLAEFSGGKKVYEKDVIELRKEIPPRYQHRYSREQLVDFLVLWDVVEQEAESTGLLKQLNVKMALQEEIDNFWKRIYQDSIGGITYGTDTSEIRKVFEENRAFFGKDSDKLTLENNIIRDVLIFMCIDPSEFKLEYHINPEKYSSGDTLLPYEEVRPAIFKNIKSGFRHLPRERMLARLKEKYQVKILDSLYMEPVLSDPAEAFKEAQTLHTERKLNEAVKKYNDIRSAFTGSGFNSLQDSVCMGLAQVLIEQEKYKEALAEYRRLLFLFPESPNNYKAQFMIGFIYAENLKKEDLAVSAFKKLLEKYPDCDLADDADWMIRNIESGGALMPKLEDG